MPAKDFHVMYATHTAQMADMSATNKDKISYNDNLASPPFVFTFGGFWLTAYRWQRHIAILGAAIKLCQYEFDSTKSDMKCVYFIILRI